MKTKNLPYSSPKKAFTLVEILVVIGIITILSALVISALNPPQLRRAARDTNRRKDLSLISVALEQYYADYNHYPDTGALDCLQSTLNGSDGSCSSTVGSTVYIKVMPTSQSATALEYCYYAEPSGNPQNFLLCAPLEAEPTAVSPIEDTGNCAISSPVTGGSLGTDFGSYCIENPF